MKRALERRRRVAGHQLVTRQTLYVGVLLSAAAGVQDAGGSTAVNHPLGTVTFEREARPAFGVLALASREKRRVPSLAHPQPPEGATPDPAATALAAGHRLYLFTLKEAAAGERIPNPHVEESRVEASLRQQQMSLPAENVLKFEDIFIMDLDPDSHPPAPPAPNPEALREDLGPAGQARPLQFDPGGVETYKHSRHVRPLEGHHASGLIPWVAIGGYEL